MIRKSNLQTHNILRRFPIPRRFKINHQRNLQRSWNYRSRIRKVSYNQYLFFSFSYGLGKGMKITIPTNKIDPEIKKKMKKEGEVKRNENFDKLAGIFGKDDSQNDQNDKGGKVFEYHEKEDIQPNIENVDEEELEANYSAAHLEEFMKSLKTSDKDIGNSTLNPEQTENLITCFLQKHGNSNNDSQTIIQSRLGPQAKRTGTQMLSSVVEKINTKRTGATLSNSLAYSQSNASVLGTGQFNSVSLVSGVKSRKNQITEEEEKLEEVELDDDPIHHRTEELRIQNEEDDLERDDD
jgi:hypothetical protein